MEKGFITLAREWQPGDEVELVLPMKAKFNTALEEVKANNGRIAVTRGPLVYCAEDAPERNIDADIVRVRRTEDGLDLNSVMSDLATRDIHNLMVEGGGRLNRSLLKANLADRLLMFVAPKVLVGGAGFIGGEPLELGEGYQFTLLSATRLGVDVLLDYKVEN